MSTKYPEKFSDQAGTCASYAGRFPSLAQVLAGKPGRN
jgi:hypothetical protein